MDGSQGLSADTRVGGHAQGLHLLARGLLLSCLALLCMGSMGCTSHAPLGPTTGPAHVLVARRGWHIDVGFDATDLAGPLAFVKEQFPQARYVFFGFGDERYVRSHSHHLPALAAAIWPGRGVVLVTAIENSPGEAFGADQVIALSMSDSQRDRVRQSVGDAFQARPGDEAPLQSGPYADSLYYSASARYSGVHTCNTWVAELLRSAGLPVHAHGVLFAGQLWRQLRPLARADAH